MNVQETSKILKKLILSLLNCLIKCQVTRECLLGISAYVNNLEIVIAGREEVSDDR